MTEHYGAGVYLSGGTGLDDRDVWDLDVDESGDVRTVDGVDELRKDVAFRSARRIQEDGIIGTPLTPTTRNRLRSLIRETINNEPRLSRIVSMDCRCEIASNSNALKVDVQVTTNEEELDLIFEVD